MADTNEMREWAPKLGFYGRSLLLEAADTIDQQAALIAKYEAALKQYADHNNWAKTHGCESCYDANDPRDWWQIEEDGWEVAENALKGGESDEQTDT